MAIPRLWSWRMSPFAGKARIAFAEKGVAVELERLRQRPSVAEVDRQGEKVDGG